MSLKSALTVAAAGALFVAGASLAQQPAQNPLDVVPDKMPFDIPYGPAISLDHAQAAVAAAIAESKKRGWKLNVAVVGPGGDLIAFARQDGAQLASVQISQHKARTAARYRRETVLFERAVQNNIHYILTLDDVIASRGGIPLVQDGKLIGAIGCSGGTGSQDEVICKAGAGTINK
jgi:uncharacterized protein GlcG (DUF336 family)